jgi:hypothetical protein
VQSIQPWKSEEAVMSINKATLEKGRGGVNKSKSHTMHVEDTTAAMQQLQESVQRIQKQLE